MLTFLPRFLRPPWRAPGAFVSDASPVSRTLLVLCVNQGISAFSLFHFLIVDSVPQDSGPLKDPNNFLNLNIASILIILQLIFD